MDAGRLQIDLHAVNLTRLLAAHIDDLSALPETTNIEVKSDCPALEIEGDEHYVALICKTCSRTRANIIGPVAVFASPAAHKANGPFLPLATPVAPFPQPRGNSL